MNGLKTKNESGKKRNQYLCSLGAGKVKVTFEDETGSEITKEKYIDEKE
jgi:hypothetical protein